MGNSSFQNVTATRVQVANAPSSSDDAVRLGDLDAAVAGKADAVHTHVASDVMDLTARVSAELTNAIADSETVAWVHQSGTGGHVASVVLADDSLEAVPAGLQVSAELQSDVAAAFAAIHPPVTGSGTGTATVAVNGSQVVSVTVVAEPGGGVLAQNDGLAVDFGTGHTQAARGDHLHTGVYQVPVTVLNVGHNVLLSQSGTGNSLLSADVRLDADPPGHGAAGVAITSGPQGLYVPTGTIPGTVSAGDHTHAAATTTVAGFMSAADKAKLNGFTQVGVPYNYHQVSALIGNGWVEGFALWPDSRVILRIDALHDAPAAPITLLSYVGTTLATLSGTGHTFTLSAGPDGTQVLSRDTYGPDFVVPAECLLRWRATSGPAGAGHMQLQLTTEPSQ